MTNEKMKEEILYAYDNKEILTYIKLSELLTKVADEEFNDKHLSNVLRKKLVITYCFVTGKPIPDDYQKFFIDMIY